MNETALLYALSTLAQTCAALVAFIGALALYRLQYLGGSVRDAYLNVRGLLASTTRAEHKYELLRLLPDGKVRELAQRVIARPETPQEGQIQETLREELEQPELLGRQMRRTQRLLILFGGWNLGAILIALLGFNFLRFLKDRWGFALVLGVVATLAVLVTGLMILELLGSLPRWLDRFWLSRLRCWLEREYEK